MFELHLFVRIILAFYVMAVYGLLIFVKKAVFLIRFTFTRFCLCYRHFSFYLFFKFNYFLVCQAISTLS